MTFGLSTENRRLLELLVVAPLKAKNAKTWVFGSRAIGSHKEFSDIDILYEANQPFPPGFIAELKEVIEESNLPIKVDLVSVADLAPSFKEAVLLQRVKI